MPLVLPFIADGAYTAALETLEPHLFEPGRQSLFPAACRRLPEPVSFARIAFEPAGLLAAHRFEVSSWPKLFPTSSIQ